MDPTLAAWLAAVQSSDGEFVDRLWRQVLRRPVEPDVHDDAVARLRAGMSRAALLQELATSVEFERMRILDDAVAAGLAAQRAGDRPRGLRAPPGTDERPIEIPWCLARCGGEARLLDVGYAFAEPAYVMGLLSLGASVTGVDLVAAEIPGITSVQADVRKLPFPRGSFELAVAISTLEHVGRDNAQYGLATEDDDGALRAALRELRRVLGHRGRLLVTVPTGTPERRPEQLVLAPAAWTARFEDAGFVVYEDELYELTGDGWVATTTLSDDAGYGERGPGASAVLCAELRPGGVSTRLRLALRDFRHPDEPRRAT